MSLKEDATTVLLFLANFGQIPGDSQKGRYTVEAKDIVDGTGLSPEQVNDAVELLEGNAYVQAHKWLGTHPYAFGNVELTARGRYEAEAIQAQQQALETPPAPISPGTTASAAPPAIRTSVTPVGSPYGFTDHDWATVAVDRENDKSLVIAFGYQWKSKCYETPQLEANIEGMFSRALSVASKKLGVSVALDFRKLQGGYGSHLFNEIARDIIGSDIAVFETSDLNPNVMIEMGVTLTWGVRVLPIRCVLARKPPSDISGQTWAEYSGHGLNWTDTQHAAKLEKMVEFALKRKIKPL
jgi:hypothetical protein